MEKIMQTQQMKELVKISSFSKAIPTSKETVTVASLLTKEDEKRIENMTLGTIAIKVGKEAFFLSTQHKVPAEAVVQRNELGQVLGIPVVAGG